MDRSTVDCKGAVARRLGEMSKICRLTPLTFPGPMQPLVRRIILPFGVPSTNIY